jgi:fumarate hydratase class II
VDNFPISGTTIERSLIAALAAIKGAAALENARLRVVDKAVAQAIAEAAAEVARGEWDGEFPIDVFQTGSGTSSNMNMNEVLATLASERLGRKVHPNDDVNASQSSNDVFPSAIHVAATTEIAGTLIPALEHLAQALRKKSRQFKTVVKSGRTHLMDATPVTLGQEFGGYAAAVEHGVERLQAALPRIGELPLGGTAVGTGINAPKSFAKGVIARLAAERGLPLTEARDHFEAQGARDALVEASGVLKTIAVSLYKCATDLRWMGSGPRTGLAEIRIPDLQPGSSIMPGKVNPTQAEALTMLAVQVMANDVAVGFGGASGYLEMNVYKPLMIFNLTHSITLLTDGCMNFRKFLVEGTEPNRKKIREYVDRSLMLVTALAPVIGYDRASKIAHHAMDHDLTLKEAALQLGFVSEEEFDRVVDPAKMVRPYVAAGQ